MNEMQTIREEIKKVYKALDSLPEGTDRKGFFLKAMRPMIREMEPEERRRFCEDWAPCLGIKGTTGTGRFFNGIGRRRSLDFARDDTELGRKIMRERNANWEE